ncbi:L-dopachrome isomerase [Caenorhabditis elegans]|uniref:L-dopachrome isomerase n=1 Tax=Caenorhabditis elegans TaxID=6239 RepID=Q9U228_CAEEL|nr:Macrophage migration inhibitory factor [Caenorhabditis elegans]CAB60512.1 Macrophage migration inhibitory factor [Caenorhabditis elegans]|eukprot:NP_499536.1 MIF (Macrophage migration Inhibitory Factor) related [Caenorhabditis elegans]
MPVFSINVNVKVPAEKQNEILKELSTVLGKLLNKPEQYMCIHFHEDQGILYAGTTEPAGFAVLKSIGGVGSAKQNNAISAVVFPIIEKHLGIPGNRLYIEFVNLGAADIAYNGQTFA